MFSPNYIPYQNINGSINHNLQQFDYWNHFPQNESYQNHFRSPTSGNVSLRDYGPNPFTININEAFKRNQNYRTALWTGNHLQVN